ncbi:MAG: hypothetical protein JW809_00220 [Pirellulales bacterium]|nr:hypothetical protein [Pirellulales bacterium]
MHACELVELAAVVASRGPAVIDGPGSPSAPGIQQYWIASRCRLDRWGRILKELPTFSPRPHPATVRLRWPLWQAVMEEILTGEVLVRVVAAFACAYDRRRGGDEVEPLARSALVGHLDARRRVLAFLVRGRGIRAEEALRLNRLREQAERWTDMLVGYLADDDESRQYAIDPRRARDFAEDLHHRAEASGGPGGWPLLHAALRAAFRQRLAPTSPNADLNTRIAASVLVCFPTSCFEGTESLDALWRQRLAAGAADAAGMIAAILEPHAPAPSPSDLEAADRMLDRLRYFGSC